MIIQFQSNCFPRLNSENRINFCLLLFVNECYTDIVTVGFRLYELHLHKRNLSSA